MKTHHHVQPRRLALAIGCALAAWQAQAEERFQSIPTVEITAASPHANGLLKLDAPSDTGSRLGLSPRETPASVTVVDRGPIEVRGAQDTQEILRAVPGVTAHNAPGSIGVSYRGFGSGSISQLFNGINVQYSIAARPVDSWIFDRMEAIGGPSSFLFGSGAVGGSINYITKLAETRDFAEGRLRLGADELKEASVGLNRRVGEGHYARIDVNHRDTGSWIDGVDSRSTQLAASLRSDFGRGFTHTLAYEFQQEDVDRPYWGTPVLNPAAGKLRVNEATRFKNYNSVDAVYDQRVQWLRSIAAWKVDDALQFTNTFYVYDALRDYRNVEGYRFDPANTQVIRSNALLQRHDQTMVGDRIDGIYRGRIGERRSDWSFGLDFSINRQTRYPNSQSATVSSVDPYRFVTERFFDVPGMTPFYRPDRDNEVKTTALYVENRTALLPTLNLVTAMRHERIALDLVNRREITPTAPAHYSRNYNPTTGRLGLVWDVTPGMNLHAQYATAADPPSGVLSTASFGDAINNDELTTGRQAEVGAKLDFWEGKGSATVAAYHITRKNISTPDPFNSGVNILVGEQSSQGVELALGLQPTKRLAVQGNFTYVDAEYERYNQGSVSLAGKTPTNTPSTVANLWVSYVVTPSVQAHVGARRVGKVHADAANTLHWPAYTFVDLGLNWQLNRTMSVEARVRNLTDRLYAANVGNTMAYLGAPRTADVALRMSF